VVATARHAAQLRRLMEAALAVNAQLSPYDVLKIVAIQARRVAGASRALVVLRDGDGEPVQVSVPVDEEARWPSLEEMGLRDDGSSAPVAVVDGEFLAAPLTDADGNNRGVIVLADKHDHQFTDDDEAILVSLAQMASVAL